MSSVMARLRDETMEHHKRAEGRDLERALVTGKVTRAQYRDYLAQRLHIHQALDAAVRGFCASDPRAAALVPEELYQTLHLRQDLSVLEVAEDSIVPLPATGELVALIEKLGMSRSAAILGVYYVFEGSKNGARYIARAICGALRLTPQAGACYLDPHGERQRPLWAAFKQAMDAIAWTPAEQDQMVTAAQQTFDLVGRLDDELIAEPAVAS